MTAPFFGLVTTFKNEEPRPIPDLPFATLGLVVPSNDADQNLFPLNEPVRFSSNDQTYLTKAGSGLLADSLRGINDQLGAFQAATDVVVVRVAESTASDLATKRDQTIANLIGSLAGKTGIYALLDAGSKTGATPRIIAVPGFTSYQATPTTANPIVAALPAVLNALLAIGVVDAPDTNLTDALNWRKTIQSQRIVAVSQGVKVLEGTTIALRPLSPRILGLFARVDFSKGGKPFHPIANRPISGILGPSRMISFSLMDGSSDGQKYLSSDLGILVRGEMGVDSAIAAAGFIYLGTETCAEEETWAQIHQVRAFDYLTVRMHALSKQFLGERITQATVESWIDSLKAMLRDHKAQGDILGYQVSFNPDENAPEDLRLGSITVSIDVEPAPVFKKITHTLRRYRPALTSLIADIAKQVGGE